MQVPSAVLTLRPGFRATDSKTARKLNIEGGLFVGAQMQQSDRAERNGHFAGLAIAFFKDDSGRSSALIAAA